MLISPLQHQSAMKYSTSILATVVACAYMGQARTLGDQAKATQGAKEKTILTMDYDEDYSPYNTGYGVEDGYYFYPGLERERDFGYEVRERDYGYEVEEEDERPFVRYENRYPERDYGYGRDEENRFFRKDGGCGCEGKKHRHGCERGGHGYGYEENLYPYGEESREYYGGRYGSGYDVNDDDYEVRSYGGGYISRGEDDYEREGGRRSRGFVGEEQSFGYEEEEDDYSPYGEVDYEGGYRFSGYPRGKRQRGPIYFEHEREHERENRKEREERERKDFQKYKDIDAHKKEFEVEDDKRFLELGYGKASPGGFFPQHVSNNFLSRL